MSTRSSLRTLVNSNTGRTDKDVVVNTSLDNALKSMSRLYPFDSLRTEKDIVINTNDISCQIPKAFFQLMEVRLIDPANPTFAYPMDIVRKNKFVVMFPNVAGSPVSSRPYVCYKDGTQLFWDCKANSNFIIRMTGLSLDSFQTDTSDIALKEADEMLVAYATACVYRSVQMYEDAGVWDGRFHQLQQLYINGEEKDVGRIRVAEQWQNTDQTPRENVIPPWLDPFAGQNIT